MQKLAERAFIEPMQCKPVTALPSSENWTFEIKFDGYSCIAVKRGPPRSLPSYHAAQRLSSTTPWNQRPNGCGSWLTLAVIEKT
jgi:hypothetical protein